MNALRRLFVAASATALCSLSLFASGCPSVPGECRTDADCALGEVCRNNECIPSADDSVDAGPDPVPEDAGAPQQDAGPIDSGPSAEDAGSTTEDAGSTTEDAGSGGNDDAGGSDAG